MLIFHDTTISHCGIPSLQDSAWEKGFAESKGLKLEHSDRSVRFLKSDVAVADGTWEITGRPEGNPARGHYTAILMKRDGRWLIIYDRPMVPVQPPKP